MNHILQFKVNRYIIRRGYTMIEILVVISIIGFIAAGAMYLANSSREKGRIAGLLQFSDGIKASLSESPIAYWSFNDGSATDGFGQNHGTKYGNPPSVIGVNGSALSFNGSSQYVTVPAPNGSSLDIEGTGVGGTGTITMEAWINPSSSSFRGEIVGRNDNGAAGYGINYNAGYLNLGWHACGNTNGNTFISPGKWHHVVGVVDGSNLNNARMYVDGRLDSILSMCIPDQSVSADVNIGRSSSGNYFNGLIDEVRIYGQALSFSQIRQHYAEGAAKRGIAIK